MMGGGWVPCEMSPKCERACTNSAFSVGEHGVMLSLLGGIPAGAGMRAGAVGIEKEMGCTMKEVGERSSVGRAHT